MQDSNLVICWCDTWPLTAIGLVVKWHHCGLSLKNIYLPVILLISPPITSPSSSQETFPPCTSSMDSPLHQWPLAAKQSDFFERWGSPSILRHKDNLSSCQSSFWPPCNVGLKKYFLREDFYLFNIVAAECFFSLKSTKKKTHTLEQKPDKWNFYGQSRFWCSEPSRFCLHQPWAVLQV